jgi:hypothetical protein
MCYRHLKSSGVADKTHPWHHGVMARDHDFFVNARRVVEQAIGEQINGSPLPSPKNPAAVARGTKGGKIGGVMRAAKLSPAQRKKIAKKAAKARWNPAT